MDDVWECPITFQTIDDGKPDGVIRPELVKGFHGGFRDNWQKLAPLNEVGAGIFVAVNATDGQGRKKGNIIALRAWWADIDLKYAAEPLDLVSLLSALPLAPSMIVKTPGGWHLYWLANEPMPCDSDARRGEHEGELKAIQASLAQFGADPKVCDVSRVLRLPGFFHRKQGPCLVELEKHDGPRYSRDEIRAAFPPVASDAAKEHGVGQAATATRSLDRTDVVARVAAYLDKLPPAIQGDDGSGDAFKAALKVITRFALTEDEAVTLLWEHYNQRCSPPWTMAELKHKVADAVGVACSSPDWGCALHPRGDDSRSSDTAGGIGSDRPHVPGYEWDARGLFLERPTGKDHDGNPKPPERVWLAPAFTLPGLLRDGSSNGWRMLIAWNDLDGVAHEAAIPLELLSGEGAELVRILAQGGLLPASEPVARKALVRYLLRAHSAITRRVRLVDSLGWNGGAFVLPTGETIGEAEEVVRFSGEVPGVRNKATSGTLEGWQDGVARPAVGNPYLAFCIASAFAGPLLALVSPDGGGGFHLQGRSSQGKSTGLVAAMSVWGNPLPLPTWRATSNGLEGIAALHNDGLLVLDELSQVEAKDAGQMAYMLANGSAKARMAKDLASRPMKQWKLIILSNGEVSLEDKVSEDNKQPRAKAGQEVRLVDIPCPDAGLFADLHGFAGGGELSEHLKAEASKHYGHAIRIFLEGLSRSGERHEETVGTLKSTESDWLDKVLPPKANGQVRRVAKRFALVAVAGELAQSMGILPWPKGEAFAAATVCFNAWLERRGHTGASEEVRGIAAVVAFIERHGMSRFDEWGISDHFIPNRIGTRRQRKELDGWDYYLTAEGWAEATKGFNPPSVARACIEAGILEKCTDGKSSQSVGIPSHGKARYYVIRASALAEHLAVAA